MRRNQVREADRAHVMGGKSLWFYSKSYGVTIINKESWKGFK